VITAAASARRLVMSAAVVTLRYFRHHDVERILRPKLFYPY
jgi:hypothetical protein